MADDEPPRNPFVRWKQHVDAHIGATLHNLIGIPTLLSQGIGPQPGSFLGGDVSSPLQPSIYSSETPVDAAQAEAWLAFYFHSPYSPRNLQHISPPKPAPLRSGATARDVSFADAFDDLLAEAAGQPMRDLHDAKEKREIDQLETRRRSVEDARTYFHKLNRSRLLDAYFPRLGRPLTRHQAELLDFEVDALERFAGWRQEIRRRPDHHEKGRGLFDELDSIFRVLNQILQDDEEDKPVTTKATETNQPPTTKKLEAEAQSNEANLREPQTEDELYEAVRSAYANADKSLSIFLKAITDASAQEKKAHDIQEHEGSSETKRSTSEWTGKSATEGKTVKTVNEHVDEYGNKHSRTVVSKLDADGKEIVREERYSVRSPDNVHAPLLRTNAELEDKADEASTTPPEPEKGHERPPEKRDATQKSGWLWK